MTGVASAQENRDANSTESPDVTVGVSDTIAVDVQPANLNFDGAIVGQRNTSTVRDFGAVEIENTGSTYIERVWLNTSVPQTNPFGSGSAEAYDAGNFLEVRPTGDFPQSGILNTKDYKYVNRKDFMGYKKDTGSRNNIPSFIQVPGDSEWKDFHAASLERGNETIYMVIDGDSSGTCQGTSSTVRVGNVSATDSRLGSVDFTDQYASDYEGFGWTEYQTETLTGTDASPSYGIVDGVDLNWTYTNSDDSGDLSYDVLTHCGQDLTANTVRTSYNPTVEGSDSLVDGSGSATNYLVESTSSTSGMLAPGDRATLETAINIPEGVAAGQVGQGTFRILITADPDENTADDGS